MDLSLEKRNIRYRTMIDALLSKNGAADTVLKNGNIINVITREIYPGDIAIKGEYILMTGDCRSVVGENTKIIDVHNCYIAPGFIDSHMHFESSMLTCTEFSKLSIVSGTTTLVADPHEIGNVLGIKGIKAMIEEAKKLPNRVLFTVPALTPDVPGLETAGEEINSTDMEALLKEPCVQGIGEMQGFSNPKIVYEHDSELVDDLLTSSYLAKKNGCTIEGNAPGLTGEELAAHIIVCGNEISCHETTTKEECMEKLRNGVTVFMREGSTQKNMAECIRAVTEEGMDSRKLVLVTDDMVAEDLLTTGHMNEIVRRTIAKGLDPVEAIQMVTINAAVHFGRKDIGVLAPGKAADISVISDLINMRISRVFIKGKEAAREGKLLLQMPHLSYPEDTKHSMKCKRVKAEDLKIAVNSSRVRVRGIQLIEDQNLTGCIEESMNAAEGYLEPDIQRDLLPLVSIERHGRNGNIGKTFLRGLGLKEGAIAISVAHDTHNLLVCGADYEDMVIAANRVMAMDGGIALVKERKVLGDLRLPFGGLMTDEMDGHEVGDRIGRLQKLAEEECKCTIHSPFMHLSFVSLLTSPKWKISDMGLVDTENYKLLSTVIE